MRAVAVLLLLTCAFVSAAQYDAEEAVVTNEVPFDNRHFFDGPDLALERAGVFRHCH